MEKVSGGPSSSTLANDQSLHNLAIDVVERLWKLARIAENARLGAVLGDALGGRSWAAVAVHAFGLGAGGSVLAGSHAGD